jgi:hypothetical protein
VIQSIQTLLFNPIYSKRRSHSLSDFWLPYWHLISRCHCWDCESLSCSNRKQWTRSISSTLHQPWTLCTPVTELLLASLGSRLGTEMEQHIERKDEMLLEWVKVQIPPKSFFCVKWYYFSFQDEIFCIMTSKWKVSINFYTVTSKGHMQAFPRNFLIALHSEFPNSNKSEDSLLLSGTSDYMSDSLVSFSH